MYRYLFHFGFVILFSFSYESPINASELRNGHRLFVISSTANIRAGADVRAAIVAKLPIATPLIFRYEAGNKEVASVDGCGHAKRQDNIQWYCVSYVAVEFGMNSTQEAWVAASNVGSMPVVDDLLMQYDKAVLANSSARLKWAERAAALAPLNQKAQKILIEELRRTKDSVALEQVKQSFKKYRQPEFIDSPKEQLIYYYRNRILEPVAILENNKIKFFWFQGDDASFKQQKNIFYNRGAAYRAYSGGVVVGSVQTEAYFNCLFYCPAETYARLISSAQNVPPHNAIATNYELTNIKKYNSALNQLEKNALVDLAEGYITKTDHPAWTTSNKKAFFENARYARLKLTDEQFVLVGNWEIGNRSDAHYGDQFYKSLLIIALQVENGAYKPVYEKSLADSGCRYTNHADFDLDKEDEILMYCDGVEGEYYYGIVDHRDNKWFSEVSNSRP